MSGKHIALLAAIIGGVAAQLAGIHDWHDATTPLFVAGILSNVSAGLIAVFVKAPSESK